MKNLALIVLLALALWFAATIVRLERYHYAAMIGLCDREAGLVKRDQCLSRARPRIGALYDLAYGLRLL